MSEVVVLSPSFGRWSPEPAQVLADAGLRVRRAALGAPMTPRQVIGQLPGAAALIVGLDAIDASVIAEAARRGELRVIAKHGVGVDNIDVAAAARAGIPVVHVPALNSGAVADLVLGLMLALLRRIPEAQQGLREGGWPVLAGPELSELAVGIAGFGRIGRGVARRLEGFDASVAAIDPYLPPDSFGPVRRTGTLEELLETSDLVTLHLPGGQDGPLLDEAAIARMRPGAWLVNAARGELVDEHAVARALRSGHLAGYAADAFTAEPPTGSPLLEAPNTLLTPHMGAYTRATNARMGVSAARSIIAALAGAPLDHEVRPAPEEGRR